MTLIAFLFFGLQYTFYKIAQVHLASAGSPLLTVIAYHLRFLMVLTFSAGIWIPLSVWLENRSGKPQSAWIYGVFFLLLTVTGFVLFSYASASRLEKAASADQSAFQAAGQKAVNDISSYAQFVDADIRMEKEGGILKMFLKFRNTSKKDITQVDYRFVALEDGRIFYRINIRDTFLIAPGQTASAPLVWERAKFKDPALFERMSAAFKSKALKVYAKPMQLTFIDGSSIHE